MFHSKSSTSPLPGTDISPTNGNFEDDFPFPQVRYVGSLEGIKLSLPKTRCLILFGLSMETIQSVPCWEIHVLHMLFEGLQAAVNCLVDL